MADDDLRNTQSLYADGSPITDSRFSAYPPGAVPGYWSPGPVGTYRNDQGNPWSSGAGNGSGDAEPTTYITDGFDALYAHALSNLTGGTDTAPTASEMYEDSGYGPSGKGRS